MITTFKLANDLFDPTVAKEFLCFNGNENERYELRRHNYYIKKNHSRKIFESSFSEIESPTNGMLSRRQSSMLHR